MSGDKKLTEAQETALRVGLANHGIVVVSRGFGRDRNTPHAITGKVYRKLVVAGYLTPWDSRATWKGEVLMTEAGKPGYLTAKGEEAAKALPVEVK